MGNIFSLLCSVSALVIWHLGDVKILEDRKKILKKCKKVPCCHATAVSLPPCLQERGTSFPRSEKSHLKFRETLSSCL